MYISNLNKHVCIYTYCWQFNRHWWLWSNTDFKYIRKKIIIRWSCWYIWKYEVTDISLIMATVLSKTYKWLPNIVVNVTKIKTIWIHVGTQVMDQTPYIVNLWMIQFLKWTDFDAASSARLTVKPDVIWLHCQRP